MVTETAGDQMHGRQSVDGSILKKNAYSEIEERIVLLKFKPGQVLSEVSVSRELGIGRTPVREALQRLAMEGMVSIIPSRGIIVTSMDPVQHIRLLETRRRLEELVAELAAQRASTSERKNFHELARKFRQASKDNDEQAFLEIDRNFNTLLLVAAKNDYTTKCMRLMAGLSRRHFYYYRQIIDLSEVAKLHANIAEAISIGEVKGARDAVNELMNFNEAFTKRAIETPWVVESV